jgi:CheY-like chemotaxis protein
MAKDGPRRDTQPIVVIDDSAAILYALDELLGAAGYPAMTVGGGVEALAAIDRLSAAAQPPALFVVDLVMDDVNGFDVILRARTYFPATPVLAMSGGTRSVAPDLSLELARQSGADECLQKPFGNDEFLSAVRRLSSAAHAARPERPVPVTGPR